jgi:integrase
MLIGSLLDKFVAHVAQLVKLRQRRPNTLRNYTLLAAKYFAGLRDREASSVTAPELRQWHIDLALQVRETAKRRDAVGVTTANRALVVLDLAIKHAIRDQLLPAAARVTALVERMQEMPRSRYLSPAEIAALRDALYRVERDRVRKALPSQRELARAATQALLLISLTGMRLNEALKLRVQEVDVGYALLKLPHTKRGYREVPLSEPAVELLREQLERAEEGWVFPSSRGGPLQDIYAVWHAALGVSGINTEGVVVHTLRHSLIVDLLRHGADIKVAADIAGHSDLDVTRSIYGRPIATLDARRAVNDFAARIGATRTVRAA